MLRLFFYRDKFLFLPFTTGATPGVRKFLERCSCGDVLLGVSLFRVVGVLAGAFELGHIVRVLVVRLKGRAGALPKKKFRCPCHRDGASVGLLLGGLPLAADRRDDGAFLLEFGESLVHILAVQAGDLCNLAGVHGCAEFAHGF